jgi:hypothetical protein
MRLVIIDYGLFMIHKPTHEELLRQDLQHPDLQAPGLNWGRRWLYPWGDGK